MCIHTLRYFHDGCTHPSIVPTSGPGFIPPEKCTTVRNALQFYHTQPLRPPEMYPPPCPRPCAPVWGNEACKGNVRCAFRPGKCDDCIREDQLMDMARYLINSVKISANDCSVAGQQAGVLMLWNPKNRKEMKRQMTELKRLSGMMEEFPGSFDDEDGLRPVVAKVLVEKTEARASEVNGPLWRLFSSAFAEKLSVEEFVSLGMFLDGPPLDMENHDAGRSSVASSLRGSPMSFSSQLAASKLGEKMADIESGTFAQTMSLPVSPVDNEFKTTLSEPDIPANSYWPPPQINYQSARTATSTPAFGSGIHPPTQAPYLPPHKRLEQSHRESIVLITSSTSHTSQEQSVDPGWCTGVVSGSCFLPHHVGRMPPPGFKAQTKGVLGTPDQKMAVIIERSALDAAKMVYTRLAEGDAREDFCGAGCGNYVDKGSSAK